MWGYIIGVILIVAIVYFFNSYQNKYQSFQGGLFNLVVIVFLFFLILSVGFVYLNGDVKISKFSDVVSFGKSYLGWLGNFFGTTKNIVGYTVKQNWSGNVTTGK